MFDYQWKLKDGYPAKNIKKHGLRVFSTFACGGGSSMGYKLAGYDVVGANDIDPQMARIYKKNHNPKFYDLCPISDFLRKDLPKEYFELDILDGSPPCSTFSIAGKREHGWKKEKKFREGQVKQCLSDLFFEWIKLVDKLKPKVAIAENVKGIILGNAKLYTKEIAKRLNKIGYEVQVFLLDASKMGVPQKRERVFFVCRRKDLKLSNLKLQFNEKKILGKDFLNSENGEEMNRQGELFRVWRKRKVGDKNYGDIYVRNGLRRKGFGRVFLQGGLNYTLVSGNSYIYFDKAKTISKQDVCQLGTFPLDYDFLEANPTYVVGMSVPPVMMAQIATQIFEQWFKNLKRDQWKS